MNATEECINPVGKGSHETRMTLFITYDLHYTTLQDS